MNALAAPPPGSGAIRDGAHVFALRVYYEDTDAAGIVYHANHLKFAERARTEFLRLAGIEQERLRRELGLGLAVRRCLVTYRRAARLDDWLTVHTTLVRVGGASIDCRQTIRRDGDTVAELEVGVACIDEVGRPARLPAALLAALAPFSQPDRMVASHAS